MKTWADLIRFGLSQNLASSKTLISYGYCQGRVFIIWDPGANIHFGTFYFLCMYKAKPPCSPDNWNKNNAFLKVLYGQNFWQKHSKFAIVTCANHTIIPFWTALTAKWSTCVSRLREIWNFKSQARSVTPLDFH